MTAPGIRLAGCLSVGERALIGRLDMRLPAGRWSVLLGSSGVGKTSLLRLIAGLPCAARLDGLVAAGNDEPPPRRVAMMAQGGQLLSWADAVDNVTICARLRGETPDPDKARALLGKAGLAGLERRKPAALSAGQCQRVALARALYEDCPVVLLDEPFSALDVVTRSAMQDLAARLLAGRTVVLVTHDPAEAIRLADEAWLLTEAGAARIAVPPSSAPRALEAQATLAAQAGLLARMRSCFSEGPA